MTELCDMLHVKRNLHVLLHPGSYGLVECYNGVLTNKLSRICAQTGLTWVDALSIAISCRGDLPQISEERTQNEWLHEWCGYMNDYMSLI